MTHKTQPTAHAEITAPISADLRRIERTSPVSQAVRLLREAAAELKNCHTIGGDWGDEIEALDAYNEHMAVAATLEQAEAGQAVPAPVTYMATDNACKWAWDQVRKDVGTEGWTTSESCNFYGFFMWGWHYRGQYETQRPAAPPAPAAVAVPDEGAMFEAWVRTHEDAHGAFDDGSARTGWEARAALAAAPAQALDDRAAFKAYLQECDDCEIVPDVAGAFHAAWQKRAAPAQAVAVPAVFGDEDHVLVPRALIGSACSAIDKKRDGTKTLAELRRYTVGDLSAAAPAQDAASSITIDFKQATELLEMFGGEPAEVTLMTGDGHSGNGLYASYTDMPEEGAGFLGTSDDEAVPAAPAQEHATQLAGQGQTYSIDADPQGIRARVADAITGALGLGAQGSGNPPPDHWLTPFWNQARFGQIQYNALRDSAEAMLNAPGALTLAARDVLAERARQVERKGYDPEHDDSHVLGEIGALAALYLMPDGARSWNASSTGYGDTLSEALLPSGWSLPAMGGDCRADAVKGVACGLAEIERLDRAAARAAQGGA